MSVLWTFSPKNAHCPEKSKWHAQWLLFTSPHTTAVITTYKVNMWKEFSVQPSFPAVQNTLFHSNRLKVWLPPSKRAIILRKYLIHEGTLLKISAISLQTLSFGTCKECGMFTLTQPWGGP